MPLGHLHRHLHRKFFCPKPPDTLGIGAVHTSSTAGRSPLASFGTAGIAIRGPVTVILFTTLAVNLVRTNQRMIIRKATRENVLE